MAVLEFSTIGAVKTWPLQALQVERWQALYPTLDVLCECRKALAWVEANPSKRKTAKGMPRFLVYWLNRAVDSPRPVGRVEHRPAPQPTYASEWFTDCQRLHNGACNGQTAHALQLRIDAGRGLS